MRPPWPAGRATREASAPTGGTTIELPRVDVAGLPCTVATIDELCGWVARQLDAPRAPERPAATIACVNAHIFNLAWEDPTLRDALAAADVNALDGMSMVWAARRAGAPRAERCNMTEAFRAFLLDPDQPPSRAVVVGLDQASADRAAAAIDAAGTHCRVVAAVDGYRPLTDHLDVLATTEADLVLVGCGTPVSERLLAAAAAVTPARLVWHVGGGTLNFLAGNGQEAPAWMRRSGTQWLHRLAGDPRGLWRRYLVGNPRFVWRVRGSRARS
ncbi:hypothetical protein FTX61_03940 [Nitriliruptoraceae bacterium ZYF776]|nr:hypothetical protein [Profundirhabdus halotolerans]